MTVKGRVVTITTTPTRLDSIEGDDPGGQDILIIPPSSGGPVIGGATVTYTAVGVITGPLSLQLRDRDEEGVYGIVNSGTVDVYVLETGV